MYTMLEILIQMKARKRFHIFYQRMKVSLEARRLAKYKEKKKEISVATLQFDVTFCTPILCAPSKRPGKVEEFYHLRKQRI